MLKVGIADYGKNQWYGGFYDYEQRMDDIKALGFDGLERLCPTDAADALQKASILAKKGMDFATCLAPTIEQKFNGQPLLANPISGQISSAPKTWMFSAVG